MVEHVRVLVIGGGVTGCSVAYHLAEKGWQDIVLCEQADLSAGATAYAAGHAIHYTLNPTISRLNLYGTDLYRRLEELTGQNPGFHTCGNMRLATHENRLQEFHRYQGVAEATGVRAEILSPDEARALNPLIETDGVLAALYNPDDGHISPTDLTQAFAAGARAKGVKIHRGTRVLDAILEADGRWRVETGRGVFLCDHVVSCTGNFANKTMGLFGRSSPSVPVKHQYIITESIPELERRKREGLPEVPVSRDPEASFYVRQEGTSLLMGCYEALGETVCVHEGPDIGGPGLFQDQLDKLLPYMELAMDRFPVLGKTGIRDIINSAMPYAPDDLPLIGPAPGMENFWLAEGSPFGITLAGGIGWQLAEWIVEGEPGIDLWSCDSRRFGDFASRSYSAIATREAYEHTYRLPKPEQEAEAGRPLKTSPLHDLLLAKGAVFGAVQGWERPNWFAPIGMAAQDDFSTFPPNYFEAVGAECRALREEVGLCDLSAGSLFQVSGEGAERALASLLASGLPVQPGNVGDGRILSATGRRQAEFTIVRKDDNAFLLIGAAGMDGYFERLLSDRLSDAEGGRLDHLTGRWGALGIGGPMARDLLEKVTVEDVSNQAFPHGAAGMLTIGLARVYAVRMGLGGELGWNLYCPVEFLRHLYLMLLKAAPDIRHVGARALNSLRLEKALPDWPTDEGGPSTRQVCLRFGEEQPLALAGFETVRSKSGETLGHVTSAAYGHCVNSALAMARIEGEANAEVQVRVGGHWMAARILEEAAWDPSGARLMD